MEFFQTPAVFADRLVPAARALFARKVVQIIPAARRMLRGDQTVRHIHRCLVIELVARRVEAIEIEMANSRRAWRLHPDHRWIGFHLAPTSREVSRIAPHITAAIRHALAHEPRGALHRAQRLAPQFAVTGVIAGLKKRRTSAGKNRSRDAREQCAARCVAHVGHDLSRLPRCQRDGAFGAGASKCFRILPAAVRGNSSTNVTCFGVL